jgi:hypothetical protein
MKATEKIAKKDWIQYLKNNIIPLDIPKNPNIVYKNIAWKGWVSWMKCISLREQYSNL